jgi:hypothetical protein
MKLTHKHKDTGSLTVERTLRSGGKGGTELVRQNRTEGLGPFSRDENPARVGCTVGATLARNYHSVTTQITINIPAHPTEAGVDQGLAWCFAKANDVLNDELEGANRALDKLSKSRG